MVIHPKKDTHFPALGIEESRVEEVSKIVYLGDIVNSKGNNIDLIEDRVKRGTSAMVQIEA